MTNQYEELIRAFEAKLRKLVSEYKSLQVQNELLKSELTRKQEDLMIAHKDILELRSNYDHLRTGLSLGLTETDRAEAKQRINKLIREIDKCIALMDE